MSAVPRTYATALLLLVVGGALAFVAYGQTWVTVTTSPVGLPSTTVVVSGRELDPGAGYLPLLLLAAVLAVWATSGWARRAVGAVAAVAALVVLGGAVRFAPPLRGPVVTPDGVVAGTAAYTASAWWLPAAVAAVAALVGAVLVAVRGHTWRGMAGRYERVPRAAGPGAGPLTERAAWDLLDAGVDPTAGEPAPDAPAPAGSVPPAPAPHHRPGTMPAPALPGRTPGPGGSRPAAPHEEEHQ